MSERLEEAEGGAESQVSMLWRNSVLAKCVLYHNVLIHSLTLIVNVIQNYKNYVSFLKMSIWNQKKLLIYWRRSIKKLSVISKNKLNLFKKLKLGEFIPHISIRSEYKEWVTHTPLHILMHLSKNESCIWITRYHMLQLNKEFGCIAKQTVDMF